MIETNILIVDPIDFKEPTTIYLDHDKSSWLIIDSLPSDLKNLALNNFDIYFNERPLNKGKILYSCREKDAHRYYQSYMNTPKLDIDLIKHRSYMFSNFENCKETEQKEFPECFQIFFDYLNKDLENYNQSVINWYENGKDFLPFHKDWELGKKEGSDVATITLNKYDDENCRVFEIVPNDQDVDFRYKKIKILTRHGCILKMGGLTQKKFKHGLPKMLEHPYPRISLTFRNFI